MKNVFLKFFNKLKQQSVPVLNEPDPNIEALLNHAQRVNTTDDMVWFLAALVGWDERKVVAKAQRGFFTSYLLQLDKEQFNAKSWSTGLSLLYGRTLEFDTIGQAKCWLYQHRHEFRPDDYWDYWD